VRAICVVLLRGTAAPSSHTLHAPDPGRSGTLLGRRGRKTRRFFHICDHAGRVLEGSTGGGWQRSAAGGSGGRYCLRCTVQRNDDTPADLQARLDAERRRLPFVVFRDAAGRQHLVTLDPDRDELTVGRADECTVRIEGDREVSRLHALLVRRGGAWTVEDSGLSRNGTFLNGERLCGRRVLRNRDVVHAGTTDIDFFDPSSQRTRTITAHGTFSAPEISPAQRRVLFALCSSCTDRPAFAIPRSNEEIAAELVLSVDTVKSHLQALFSAFGLEGLPRVEKRARLAEEAVRRGVIRRGDVSGGEGP
jgi:pSer/pThr/pTyr-binding forkhead associated (FHA) protein